MAAVAVVLDHEATGVQPVRARRPDLRVVAASPNSAVASARADRLARLAGVAVLGLAAVASVLFVIATGDGIPASVASRGVAAVSQPVVPPAGAAAAIWKAGDYVVRPGDSLWSIASSLVSESEVPAMVETLKNINGGAALTAGQVLQLPVP
jgi:LysM repeat protein